MTFVHLEAVLAEVRDLAQVFTDAGHRIYLVGGIVRDQWLDQPLDGSSDIDLTTDARPHEIKRLVSPIATHLWTQGEKFGTIGMRARDRDYEITTHRAENYDSSSRKPSVDFGDEITEDLSRRDFTVNAMAIELPDGDLVDPHAGADDLRARRLRTPLAADVSFSDDPLRMMRAARFSTKFELDPDDSLVDSATRLHDRLRIVAIERIGVELRRLLEIDDVRAGLRFLATTGLLAEVLGYGDAEARAVAAERTDAMIGAAETLGPDWHRRLAAIGLAGFDGADGVRTMCRRLRLSRDDERAVTAVASAATEAIGASDTSDESLRRWRHGRDAEVIAAALDVAAVLAREPSDIERFGAALADLRDREDPHPFVPLDGAAIMKLLGVGPGPVVGRAQKHLREQYLVGGPMRADEQADELVRWYAER